ncbi:MAG TPA: Gfo/Idh/MocA family oxidoreductase [Tepidisphaeraceae bacterium]|nr:Gfo/Idh/MocA family oxidoreductase [Tepidisphaeraceae bacterium]
MSDRVRVGIVGCGAISGAYLKFSRAFPILEIVACSDIDPQRAQAKAAEFEVPQVLSVDDLLESADLDIVLNLTIPRAHADITGRALACGRHVFSEKPLAITTAQGKEILESAKLRQLRLGCAPDTFMGAGIQTARKLIDEGAIGRPLAFTAFMMCPGHEHWHPNPEFFYEPGGGPMFDMGPYYLTALLNFFGPIRRIMGAASIAIPERTILAGARIAVQTPDHVCGTIEFKNGVMGTLITSFATRFPQYDANQPITIYGTDGTLKVPDPNMFDGPVHLRRKDDPEFAEMPHTFPVGYGRSVGLADMAHALRSARPHRANGEQAYAVLEAMEAFLESSKQGRAIEPQAKYERPEPMPDRPLQMPD